MQVTLKAKGLYTALSNFSAVPEGAMAVADNCSIDFDDLIECRRGFDVLTYNFNNNLDVATRYTSFQDTLIAHTTSGIVTYYDANLGWRDYAGSYLPVDANLARVRFQSANSNLYFTSSTGIQKLDTLAGTIAASGVPKALDMTLSLTGSSGFLTNNPQVTATGTTGSGSPTITSLNTISGIVDGQYVSGTGIPAGATVSAISESALVLATTANSTAGSAVVAVTVATGIVAGQLVAGTNVPQNTVVSSIVGSNVTLSNSMPATQTAAAITFSSVPSLTLSANATATNTGVTLTFSDGSQVGYRGLWVIKDANNNLQRSAPSQLTPITNTLGHTSNVALNITIPPGITTNHAFQLFRSAQTVAASVTPTDECQQVAEFNPTSGDITAGYVTYTDNAPDSIKGDTLYTSPSEEGIAQANEPPPVCWDFCNFLGYTLFLNTTSKQRFQLTILGVGSPNGVQVGDVITIGGAAYTADSSENTATGHFQVVTTGTPAQNITDTANSLIRCINRYASSVSLAYNISDPTGVAQGKINIEERTLGGSQFAVTASGHGTAYSPALPTSGTTVHSQADRYRNGVMISKQNQPEAVPLENVVFAGSADADGYRIIPLRNYVLILKTDGIFQFSGTSAANFQVRPFDLTTRIVAPDSAVSLSNEVWMLSDQGVVSVSDGGVQIRSRPIENTILDLFGTALDETKYQSFGIGYETDRKYILFLPSNAGDTHPSQAYVFNTLTKCWTRWERSQSAGFVNQVDNKLYLAKAASPTTNIERKTGNYTDFVDEGAANTIVSSDQYEVTLGTTTIDYVVGDLLYQDSTHFSVITSIDADGLTVTVQDLLTWTAGDCTVYAAIPVTAEWVPAVQGNPGIIRQWPEASVLFRRTRFFNGQIGFRSEISASFEDIQLDGVGVGGFGLAPFGTTPFGGQAYARPVRVYVPQRKQYCSQLSVRFKITNAYSDFAIQGISLPNTDIGYEISK